MITKAAIKSTYPLPVYNYRVRVGDVDASFSELNGLNLQYEPVTYRHGLSWKEGAEHMPGMKQMLRFTLKRGLVPKRSDLADWIGTIRQNKVDKKNLTIVLCDENMVPVVTWQVMRAFPLKMSAPAFNASSNDIAIEELELAANDVLITFH